MAVFDLQVFVQERARAFDNNLDTTPGSPFDTQVVQPILRRLGQDPFSVDLAVFLDSRMKQGFPELASDEGDALTDLLIKPAVLLWDPLVREIFRVRQGQSFQDPESLTTDESEALGANLFAEREKGEFARGQARTFFSQPRTISFSPTNFFTSRGGLHYFPDGLQSITLEEMLLNVDGELFYFDVDVVAENAGDEYNIGPNELITVANIESAVKVNNLRRFGDGDSEESAPDFVARTQQELTERSMVTLRGIGARITKEIPEVSRIAVVGFNDPEMQRDVIKGGGLGDILSAGTAGLGFVDGDNKVLTRRFKVDTAVDTGVDFTSLIGPPGATSGFTLTLVGAFGGTPPSFRDLDIVKVIDADEIEVSSQVISLVSSSVPWTLRKSELTISDIPGGILFPDGPQGTVTIPDDEVHVGGSFDVHVRGVDFEETTLVIDDVSDDEPVASGTTLNITTTTTVTLADFILDTNYTLDDIEGVAFTNAKVFGFTLQILNGVNAGSYRVLDVVQVSGSSPVVTVDQVISVVGGDFRWRLVDVLQIDLIDPKETRVTGSDLETVQNIDTVTTTGATDFTALGVSVNDTLRINEGPDKGDFNILALPTFDSVQLDQALTSSSSSLSYTIFRANAADGLVLPLIRVTGVELLDTSGQPVGSSIPYAKPIDCQTTAFQNPGRGVKVDVSDARLGLMSLPQPGGGFILGGKTLTLAITNADQSTTPVTTAFSGTLTAAAAVAEINAAAVLVLGAGSSMATVVSDPLGDRVGILPLGLLVTTSTAFGLNTSYVDLFGVTDAFVSSADVRSVLEPDFKLVTPAIDEDGLDVVQILNGRQIGVFGPLRHERIEELTPAFTPYTGLFVGKLVPLAQPFAFAPEIGVRVQVGARSIGSTKCFFLEPTSIEFDKDSLFTVTLADGSVLGFIPDPTLDATKIPAQPSTVNPKDGVTTTATTFTSASQDFVLSGLRDLDVLKIEFVPIIGTAPLADPVASLALTTLIVSVDGSGDQTITFVNDSTSIPVTDVTRAGVVTQINNAVGRTIAQLGSANELELEADVNIIVRGTGTANPLLFLPVVDTNNQAPNAGRYEITTVTTTVLTLGTSQPNLTSTRQSYKILRPGTQRLSATEMNENTEPGGLYSFDVELVSEGTGDLFNIPAALQLGVEVFRSDGYFLTTEDENLTFSPTERPKLHLSRSILEVGVSDAPANATQISGQNIEINYERSDTVVDTNNFALSETERVVCSSPLGRHLVPHFVRFDFQYNGGSRVDLVRTDVENYVNALFPVDQLEFSDLVSLAYQRGADSVRSPIDLIAVVHNVDRTIKAERSQDSLNTGRLASFHPDVINITRST